MPAQELVRSTSLEGFSQLRGSRSRWERVQVGSSPRTSRHAQERMRQRSIPQIVLDLLMQFGAEEHSHGAIRYSLDKKSRRALDRYLGSARIKEMDKLLNTYVVVSSDGQVITVGHRTRRQKEKAA